MIRPKYEERLKLSCNGFRQFFFSLQDKGQNIMGFKMSAGPNLLSIIIFAAFYLPGSRTLSTKGDIKVAVFVPEDAEIGKSVDLKCEWSLTVGNKLYSVKWYKDDHEFFRFVPENNPRIQTFPQPGVFLDEQANTQNSIRLTKLTLESSGQYKCEVSTEAPSFATTYRSAKLNIIALPERSPEINGLSSSYAVGENVTANCTTWPSLPPASISWTINGEPVPVENVKSYNYPSASLSSALGRRTISIIRLKADVGYFEDDRGSAILRCIAKVGRHQDFDESRIVLGHVDNQRLSAHDIHKGGGTSLLLHQRTLNLTIFISGITLVILHKKTLLAT